MALALPRRRQRMSARRRREALTFYLLLSPFIFGFLSLTLGPMLASFYFGFTTWDLLTPPKWIGLDNYVNLFTADADFIQGIKVTLSYAVAALPLGLVASLVL